MAEDPSAQDSSFFATCPRNTEGLLLEELRVLGARAVSETRAGVSFTGPLEVAYRACLWSRVASRVLLSVASFPATGVDDFYEGVSTIAWEDHLSSHGTLAVEVTSSIRRGPLARLNTHFAEQRVKDAVVDRFRLRDGTRPDVDLIRPDLRINLHAAPGETVVSIDLSGDGLHRRSYRVTAGQAPLKENLAAAVLMRAGWPRIAATGGSLLDPLCGSGTFLIEGALMASDTAPGLWRDYFGFLRWKGFDAQLWSSLIQEAEERRAAGVRRLPTILGFDKDPRAIAAANANTRKAGLGHLITLELGDLSLLSSPRSDPGRHSSAESDPARLGLVITNPPYGKRLGEAHDLVDLCETLGERLKASFSGWEAGVFTGNPDLGAHLGLRAHRTNVFYNGPILCRLLLFHIDPEAFQAPAARKTPDSTTGREPHQPSADNGDTTGAIMFANRLRKNLRHRRRWATRENISCYRVYDADLPEYAAAIDVYGDWVQVQEYAPPSSVDPVRARRRIREMMSVIPVVLEIPAAHVILKTRRPQKGAAQYRKLQTGSGSRSIQVGEGGLTFLVNLTDYLDTGLFLDHRLTRKLIQELARGKRFLNLFAYTGTATVYAAAGGAASTTSVDLSITYLDWARRNLDLNGLSGPQHGFVRADCLAWLTQMRRARGRAAGKHLGTREYDLIFLDAPTFSNSKSMSSTLDIQRDHAEIVRAAMDLLAPGGVLLFSTNFRRFKLDPALATEYEVTDISRQTIPPDFARNPRIHACFRIESSRAQRRDRSNQSPNRSFRASSGKRSAMQRGVHNHE